MQSIAQDSAEPRRGVPAWLGFPVDWIVDNPNLEGFFARAVWLVIPLQYYVLTRFPNGFGLDDYTPSAVMALASIVALLAASCVLAFVFGWSERKHDQNTKERYTAQVRIWAITLIVTWAATLALLALSYAIGLHLGLDADVVGHMLCQKLDCQHGYPTFEFPTIFSYATYSCLALAMIVGAAHLTPKRNSRPNESKSTLTGPNVLVVLVVVTALMTLLHGISTLPHHAR